jgi:hypothetical protein
MSDVRMHATSVLIQWPTVLTHFIFEAHPIDPQELDYAMLESWLLIHKFSLLHVNIHHNRQQATAPFFNASLFPRLTYLQLWRTPPSAPRIQDCNSYNGCLLGDSLDTFCWDFAPTDFRTRDWWNPLSHNEVEWLRSLASTAFENKSALKNIVVKYTLEQHCQCVQLLDYPWEYLNPAREYMAKLGINLVFDDPGCSKDELMAYYHTGKDPMGRFRGKSKGRVRMEKNEEEEGRLAQWYEEMLRDREDHGRDIRKYLLS